MRSKNPDITALATAQGCHPSCVARVLNLALLAPDIVEALLSGPVPELPLLSLPKAFPPLWAEQQVLLDSSDKAEVRVSIGISQVVSITRRLSIHDAGVSKLSTGDPSQVAF